MNSNKLSTKIKKQLELFYNNYYRWILDIKIPNSAKLIILSGILLLFLFIRLSTIQTPEIDRTNWKEIDHITISTNYYLHGFNILKPEISWPAEPPRVTAMELPLVPYFTSFLYPFLGINAFSVRFLTLLMSLLLIVITYKLVQLELGDIFALNSAFAVALLPLNNPYNKYLFSEPTLIFFSVFALYFLVKWLEVNKIKYIIWAAVGFTIAISLKPTAMYMLIPFLWVYYRKYKLNYKKYKSLVKLLLVSLIIPVAWYAYAYYLTKTSIDVFGIFGGHDKFQTFTMLTTKHWYTEMYKRITNLILGSRLDFILSILGFITLLGIRQAKLFFAYISAIFIFFIIVAEGNLDTMYRQLTIIPALSVFVSAGAITIVVIVRMLLIKLSNSITNIKYNLNYVGLLLSILLMSSTLYTNRNEIFMNNKVEPVHVNKWILAKEIDKYVSKDALIITAGEYSIHKGGYDLSPVIYYYADVKGWSLTKNDWDMDYVEKLIRKGASVFAAYEMYREPSSSSFLHEMKQKYKILYEDKEKSLLLLDLKHN